MLTIFLRKRFLKLTLVFAGLGFVWPHILMAHNTNISQGDQKTNKALIKEFLQADGFTIDKNIDAWFDERWYSDERFPDVSSQSIFQPDAQLPPIQQAVLLFDYLEDHLPHARYRINYSSNFPYIEGQPPAPWAYIEVTRFNLGPEKHAALANENQAVADIQEFGQGPNVTWRFVMTEIQGKKSHLVGASRKEVSLEQAKKAECFNQPCLALEEIIGTVGHWEEIEEPQRPDSLLFTSSPNTNATVAEVAGELQVINIGPDYGEPVESIQAPMPFMEFVISKNINGQEFEITAISHQGHLMDDALSDVWYERLQLGGLKPVWKRLVQHRRISQ